MRVKINKEELVFNAFSFENSYYFISGSRGLDVVRSTSNLSSVHNIYTCLYKDAIELCSVCRNATVFCCLSFLFCLFFFPVIHLLFVSVLYVINSIFIGSTITTISLCYHNNVVQQLSGYMVLDFHWQCFNISIKNYP